MKAKGWTETKIARWKQQRADHKAAVVARQSEEHTANVDSWLAFIRESLMVGHLPFIGLLIHFYHGSVSDGPPFDSRLHVKLKDLSPEVLGGMKEDVLYEFRAQA